jgi:hypothetical protein
MRLFLEQMRRNVVMAALIIMAIVMLPTLCGAEDSQPHFSGQAPGEKQEILRQIRGSIIAVDANTMMLTIKTADETLTVKVIPKTKFTHGDKSITLKDVTVGKTVEADINIHSQPNEVLTVKIKDQ